MQLLMHEIFTVIINFTKKNVDIIKKHVKIRSFLKTSKYLSYNLSVFTIDIII